MWWLGLALVAVVCGNVVATTIVVKAESFSRSEKLLQLMLIWLLPVAGAVASIYVAYDPTPPIHPSGSPESGIESGWISGGGSSAGESSGGGCGMDSGGSCNGGSDS